MADISYQCHHCGSVHEAESIRQNLHLNQRSIASYALPWLSGVGDGGGVARWRISRGIARGLWPRYPRRVRQAHRTSRVG
jgi:hypothetical protein